jgi:hypothetical protein
VGKQFQSATIIEKNNQFPDFPKSARDRQSGHLSEAYQLRNSSTSAGVVLVQRMPLSTGSGFIRKHIFQSPVGGRPFLNGDGAWLIVAQGERKPAPRKGYALINLGANMEE